jgi:hypothetical protein
VLIIGAVKDFDQFPKNGEPGGLCQGSQLLNDPRFIVWFEWSADECVH